MVGLFGWIEKNTGLNVSNYDFDDSGNVVGYTDSAVGVSVPSSSGSISASDISRVQDSGTGTVTETVVLEKRGNNYIVEDAFGNILTIPKGDFVDFKRNNDRDLEMIAGEATPSDRDELREMEAVQDRAEMGESAYASLQRSLEGDDFVSGDTGADVGTIKRDANGDYYVVKTNPDSNTLGRDYSIDPQDNSQGPTFGGNVSDYVAETFSGEVEAAGGSTEEPEFIGFTQLLENIVTGKTTDVPSVGFDAGTGTFDAGAAVTEQTFDEAFAANRAAGNDTFEWNGGVYTTDLAPAVDTAPVIPTGGPGTFVPGSLPAAEYSSLTVGDPLTPQLALELGLSDIYQEGDTLLPQDLVALNDLGFDVDQEALSGIDLQTGADAGTITVDTVGGANNVTDALLNLTGDMGAGDIGADEALATLNLIEGNDLTDSDVAALLPPATSANTSTQIDSAVNTAVENTGLSVQQIASGLGYDTVAGFLEELSLRIEGTAKMAEDVIGDMGVYDLAGQQFEMQGGDFAPGSESNLYAAIQSAVAQEELNKDVKDVGDSDFVQGLITTLNNADEDNPGLAQDLLKKRDPEYVAKVALQMPDPDNEGFNMAGEPITPGLWMASVAAQELLGLGLDVATIAALGPVAGGAVAFQQGTAEAGAASANEVVSEFEELKASGALDHLSEEEYDTVLDTAETQAFYTSGLAGGAVDTLVALTAGGFAPLSKALPTAINSALTGLGVLGAEGVSGGLEQVGVNAAVIQALEDQGIDPADYDKEYLDQVITAAIYETVGGTGASAASTVGSAVQNLSAKPGDTTSQTGTVIAAGGPGTFTPGALPAASDDADLTASEILQSGENVTVSTDNAGNLVLTDNDTNESVTVGSSFSTGDTLTGGETKVSDLQGTEDAVIGGTDQNVVVSNVGGNLTLTNEDTGFTAVVGAGTNANLINATNAVQNSDADAAVAAGATVGDTTASETLLGGTDTNVVSIFGQYDPNALYTQDGITYVGNPSLGVTANGVIDDTLYENGKIVKPLSEVVGTGTGGIGTIATGTGDVTTGVTGTGDVTTGITGTGDVTTGVTGTGVTGTGVTGTGDVTTGVTGTGDANTTITANNDATVTTSSDGNVTITTATDSQGNATVTTNNNVTGETTTNNVAVNEATTVTNGGVTVEVNAAVDGTTTTTTETTQAGVSSEVEGVVDVGTTADAITQAATTTTVEQPQTIVDQPQTIVDQPQAIVDQPQPAVVSPTSFTPTDTDGDPTTDPVGETQPGYTSGIADLGAGGRMRPVVAPYYQPQQTGLYSFYRPQPGVDQTPAAPVFNEPTSYLSPTGGLRYGNPYIGTNLSLAQLRELAELQGTGAAVLPSEDLMNGS